MIEANSKSLSKILIVDDKPENLRLLSAILKKQGYMVRSLRKGQMVLSSALSTPPDIILLDIMMPEMDGFEVCRQLKADEQTRDIPIIFISALDETKKKVKAFSAGGVDYITKPFHEEEVLARVKTHLNICRLQQQLKHELSDKKKAEKLLFKAKNAADAANRAKSEFLANMSHEIRTPMNSVLGFLSLTLEDPTITEKQRKYLATAYKSSKSLLGLINDILDVSKLESGRLELEKIGFNLDKMMQETIRALNISAKAKGISLEMKTAKDVPENVIGDPGRLKQILINLVGNSIKFTEKGGVTVIAKYYETRQKSDFSKKSDFSPAHRIFHFEIRDTGIGIPADKLDKIFEPFTQADGSTSRRFGGTGLGTTISRQLVELMGGRIWVESQQGKGSTFHFTVCMEPTDKVPEYEPECLFSHSCRCFRILLAEDIEENIMLAKIRLEEQGHTVIIARNGQEAVDAFQREAPDIILMDVHMPEMDGLEAARMIRELEAGSGTHIPIAALTASVMKKEHKICLEAGMDDVAGKPIDFENLFDIMEEIVPQGTGLKKISKSRPHSAPDSPPLIPGPLKGIDFKKGLRTWKDSQVYQKALLGFSRDFKNSAVEILNYVKTGDRESAYRIAHALKGVSGNLSVTEVYHITENLNAALRDKPDDKLIPVIISLASALNQSVDSIRQLEPEPDNKSDFLKKSDLSAPPENFESLKELFQELLASFEGYNPADVEPFLEKLSNWLPSDKLDPIRLRLDAFDFDRAREETENLMIKLGI